MKFTKDTRIIEALKYPGADKVLAKYIGPGCMTCPGAMMETLEFGARVHGADFDKMMKELNSVVSKKTIKAKRPK
jgi:hybrid cluster-associated redox disulfide protein